MPNPSETQHDKNDSERPNLTVLNTSMAADRTLMAWVRTSLSFMTFGFTLYKVLEAMQGNGRNLPSETTPRNAGLLLIAMAIFALFMGALEYWTTRRQLRHFQKFRFAQSPTWIMALVTMAGGIGLFLVVNGRLL